MRHAIDETCSPDKNCPGRAHPGLLGSPQWKQGSTVQGGTSGVECHTVAGFFVLAGQRRFGRFLITPPAPLENTLMYTAYWIEHLTPTQAQRSRAAAERYAILAALRESRRKRFRAPARLTESRRRRASVTFG
jgi:hypothetical protein